MKKKEKKVKIQIGKIRHANYVQGIALLRTAKAQKVYTEANLPCSNPIDTKLKNYTVVYKCFENYQDGFRSTIEQNYS